MIEKTLIEKLPGYNQEVLVIKDTDGSIIVNNRRGATVATYSSLEEYQEHRDEVIVYFDGCYGIINTDKIPETFTINQMETLQGKYGIDFHGSAKADCFTINYIAKSFGDALRTAILLSDIFKDSTLAKYIKESSFDRSDIAFKAKQTVYAHSDKVVENANGFFFETYDSAAKLEVIPYKDVFKVAIDIYNTSDVEGILYKVHGYLEHYKTWMTPTHEDVYFVKQNDIDEICDHFELNPCVFSDKAVIIFDATDGSETTIDKIKGRSAYWYVPHSDV